jgi:hypothetical protein
MEITSLRHPLPEWTTSYAQDLEEEGQKVLHGVYLILPSGLSHWILDADSANQAKEISDLINTLVKTYQK